jgi:hypothetical protein
LIRSTHVPIFRPIAIVFNNQKKQAARATATLDKADSWLRAVAEEDDEVKNMILRDLIGKNKDFLNA